ncbi:hypothetical protein LZ32DRAFT_679635 [Colletotrichum eremochloae]|nr:hypothetical protein LZ32DRAFT_679635 [Colletotrichum eremochloae]
MILLPVTNVALNTVTVTATLTTTVLSTQIGPTVIATETTTTTVTSTVALLPPGFTPAADTLPGDNMSLKRRSLSNISPVHRALDPASFDHAAPLVKTPRRQKRTNKQYPTKVECTITQTTTVTSTRTARPVTTTVPGAATTTTTTKTTTVPVTVTNLGPSVAFTITATVSSLTVLTPTITTTVTTTSTETVTATATSDPCATGIGNLVYSAGQDSAIYNYRIDQEGVGFTQLYDIASAAACCSLCFADPLCAASAYQNAGSLCQLIQTPTVEACSAPNSVTLAAEAPVPGSAGIRRFDVSNGPCGQFTRVITNIFGDRL